MFACHLRALLPGSICTCIGLGAVLGFLRVFGGTNLMGLPRNASGGKEAEISLSLSLSPSRLSVEEEGGILHGRFRQKVNVRRALVDLAESQARCLSSARQREGKR